MALDPLNEKQKKKNYAVFLSIIVFTVVIFFVSIIRMKAGTP